MTVLVVYSLRNPQYPDNSRDPLIDHWAAHESLEDATAHYKRLIEQNDLYIVNICSIIRSTDYEPMGAP